ncbi:MAG: uroporphyrinogen decarboxylase family protein [Bryobacteraceae bacterium]
MTPRERILAAIRRVEPDRVPIDFGGTGVTTLVARAHENLRAHLGLPDAPPPAPMARRFSTVIPDESIMRLFGADARSVTTGASDAQPEQALSENMIIDEWGVTWVRPEGGQFMMLDGPLHKIEEPDVSHLRRIAWPDPADPGRFRGLRERARKLHEETDYAVILYAGTGPIHLGQAVRGFAQWMEDTVLRPTFVEALLDITTEVWIEQARRALTEAGEYVDVVLYGDDIGSQRGPLFSPSLYRRIFKSRQRAMIDTVKRWGKPFLYHTCGSVYDFIPDLIDIGVDALNPVQVAAGKMDTLRLKREFGRDLCFWGGVDTQQVLPRGTENDVREEVRRRIDHMAAGGGYVLASVHNIQEDVPPANIVAMYEEGLRYGSGRLSATG